MSTLHTKCCLNKLWFSLFLVFFLSTAHGANCGMSDGCANARLTKAESNTASSKSTTKRVKKRTSTKVTRANQQGWEDKRTTHIERHSEMMGGSAAQE